MTTVHSSYPRPCSEPSFYSEDYYEYLKTSKKTGHGKRTRHNNYYPEIIDIFERAFKPIVASKDDIPFMNDVFCYPSVACDSASNAIEGIAKSLRENGINPQDKFKELRENYIKEEFLDDIIKTAKQTLRSDTQSGKESARIWCGEKGCGKTTLINHIFLKYYEEFDKNNIIWIRTSVFFKTFPRDINEVKDKFYKQCIKIITKYYSEKLMLNDHNAKCKIWEDVIDLKCQPCKVKEKISLLEKKNDEDYATRLIEYCYKNKWAFVFIIDNIDHYKKSNEIIEQIIDFSFHITKNPIRSLVIIVSRWETISDHHKFLQNVYNNFQRIESVFMPDFGDVFRKRIEYIKKRIANGGQFVSIRYGESNIKIKKADLIEHVVNYILTTNPYDRNGFIISDLSNNNIRKMFSMIETILKSHIEDVANIPLNHLVLRRKNESINNEICFDETMREHITIWSLALRDGYLYYSDNITKSWIQNIYSTQSPSQSIFLKRLILDFIFYMESKKKFCSVSKQTLVNIFVKEMGFPEDEFDKAINYLTIRDDRSPFLICCVSKEDDEHDESYTITRKGLLYTKYLADLFVYIELIIEDMSLPFNAEKPQYSLDFDLIPYDPLVITDKKERRKYRIDYFSKKSDQVIRFLSYLECRHNFEMNLYNSFKSNRTGFSQEYFPYMKNNIMKQMSRVGKSFNAVSYDII